MGERAYFGLWFQGFKDPSQRGEMVASSRHGGGDRKLRDPIFKQKHKEERRDLKAFLQWHTSVSKMVPP